MKVVVEDLCKIVVFLKEDVDSEIDSMETHRANVIEKSREQIFIFFLLEY